MRGRVNHLFAEKDLRAVIEGQVQAMLKEIDGRAGDLLLNSDTDEYCALLVNKYGVEPIVLDEAGTKAAQEDVTIDARDDPYAMVYDRGRPVPVPATKISFFVPFSGEEGLFECRPSSFSTVYPVGRVQGKELALEYTRRDHDAAAVKSNFNSDLEKVRQYLGWIANDLAALPARLEQEARTRIEGRRVKLSKDKDMLDALGFPRKP